MPQLPVILAAFANSPQLSFLDQIEKENDSLQKIFFPFPSFRYVPLSSAKIDQFVDSLIPYQEDLLIFHFGGHADGTHLHFRDSAGQVKGLAQLLGLHQEVKLLFLNGCNTQQQAADYLSVGIPAVIVTTCSIADGQACRFAEVFYQALINQHTLEEAFKRASAALQAKGFTPGQDEVIVLRGLIRSAEEISDSPWRLYVQEKADLNWRLPAHRGLQPLSDHYINNTHEFGTPIPYFLGRDELLEAINHGFQNDYLVHVLHGMMGIGKSRIVFEYASHWALSDRYVDFIWWIDASGPIDIIESQFLELFNRLRPTEKELPAQIKKEKLFLYLRTYSSWLLIFVNASSSEALKGLIPDGKGHILITSVHPNWDAAFPRTHTIEVPALNQEDSIQLLLLRSGGKIDQENASKLAISLGGYPFFLEQFADLYKENLLGEKDLFSYVETLAPVAYGELEERKKLLLQQMFGDFGPSKENIKINVGSSELLGFLQGMNYRQIPKDFILNNYGTQILADLDQANPVLRFFIGPILKWLKKVYNRKKEQKMAFLQRLIQYSLVKVDNEGLLEIPYVVHDFLRKEFALKPNLVGRFFPFLLYTSNYFAEKISQGDSLVNKKLLLPHMISLAEFYQRYYSNAAYLDKLYVQIADAFSTDLQFESALYYSAAALDINDNAKRTPSKELLGQCLLNILFAGDVKLFDMVWESYAGKVTFKTYEKLFFDGLKQYWLNNPDEAALLLEKAVEKSSKKLGTTEVNDLSTLINMLKIYNDASEEANLALLEEEQRILAENGEKSEKYAWFLFMQGEALANRSGFSEDPLMDMYKARNGLEQAEQIFEDLSLTQSISYRAILILKTVCDRYLDNTEEVKETLDKIELNYALSSSSEFSASIAEVKVSQAYVLYMDEEYDQAIDKAEEALKIFRSLYGGYPNHPVLKNTETFYQNLIDGKQTNNHP